MIRTPASRLANGACSPAPLHNNGIHRIPMTEAPIHKELDSPVIITSGKFSPPPYLFKGLFNPFEVELPLPEVESKKDESISSIEKHMDESISSNKSSDFEDRKSVEETSSRAPPPSPSAFSLASGSSTSSGTRI